MSPKKIRQEPFCRTRLSGVVALLVCGALGLVTANAQAQSKTFYVATYGNDSWSGTYVDPLSDKSDGPFLTVQAALHAATIALSEKNVQVSVEVRNGLYRFDRPLVLDANLSGTKERPFVLTGHKSERPKLELRKSASAVVEVRSADNIVLSNMTLMGAGSFGILMDRSDEVSIQRIDLLPFQKAIKIQDVGRVTIAGCQLVSSEFNNTLMSSINAPSSASNNILVSTGLAEHSEDPVMILAQNSSQQDQVSAIRHSESSLIDGMIAHYAFGPDNWRTDRIAGQNLIIGGEPGTMEDGFVGESVRLKKNSIQYAPIDWNGFDLPRTVNFWYWNADSQSRNTFFLVTADVGKDPGFVLSYQKGSIILDFDGSRKTWPAPDFIKTPTMLSLIVPHRTARFSEVQLLVNATTVQGSVAGSDPIFLTSKAPPHLASTPDRMNLYGQKHHFDELSFWNRALSTNEIDQLYNEGKGLGLFPPPHRARGEIYFPRNWDWPWQIDTAGHRDELLEIWESLKKVDIGNGVPMLAQRGFAGEPRKRIHVDPTRGNDFLGSGSPNRPFKTLHRAVNSLPLNGAQQLTQSTVIYLASGIYYLDNRLSIDSWGSETNWLAIRGAHNGGPRPIITYSNKAIDRVLKDRDDGGKGGMEELIKLQGQYIEMSGLILDQRRNELPDGVKIHGGAIRFFAHVGQNASNGLGCRILDTEIRNFLHAGIKGDAKGLIVDGVFIHDGGNTFHDHTIYISSEGNGSRFEVRRSLLMNATGAGTNQHKTSDGRDLPAPEGAIITHNVMLGCQHFGVTTAGMGGVVAHNAFGYTRWFGVHFYRSSASLTHIQNNVFVGYPDPDLANVAWTSYHVGVAKTKRAAGVVVEGNYFESGPTSDRRSNPIDPDPWVEGKTYSTSNTVERSGAFYICEVIDNTKDVSTSGPKGTNPNLPTMDGSNLRWWFLTKESNRVEDNFLDGEDSGGRNFVNALLGDFRLRHSGEAIGIGVDLGYTNGRNPGPWPNPVP